MQNHLREKFATQIHPHLLSTLRRLAKSEGRLLQSLVEEALSDLIEKHHRAQPRSRVMALYQESHKTFAPLYKKLAE